MARRKAAVQEFPPECCGVCRFCHVDTEGQGYCSASPPTPVDTEDGVYFHRCGSVDMNDPMCIHFQPRHHA